MASSSGIFQPPSANHYRAKPNWFQDLKNYSRFGEIDRFNLEPLDKSRILSDTPTRLSQGADPIAYGMPNCGKFADQQIVDFLGSTSPTLADGK